MTFLRAEIDIDNENDYYTGFYADFSRVLTRALYHENYGIVVRYT